MLYPIFAKLNLYLISLLNLVNEKNVIKQQQNIMKIITRDIKDPTNKRIKN
jgi:hypothetical protein